MSKKVDPSCFSFLRYLLILSLPLGIFAVVVTSYLNYLPYKVSYHTVIMIGVIFFIYILFIHHNAYYASCKIINSFKEMKEDLKNSIRKTLIKMNHEKKSSLDIDTFFEEYFYDIRNDNFASIASTVFPMLGILGTFISIAISMPDFSAVDVAELDAEISLLLSGVGTAFYASIYGIFLSIWWMFFEKRGLSKIKKYQLLVKKDFKPYIWDKVMLNHYRYVQNQMHNEDLVDALKENFNIHFIKNFNDSYLNSYTKLFEDTTESFEKITKDLKNATESLTATISDISSTKDHIDIALQTDRKLRDFNKAINSLDKTVDKVFTKIDSEVADIVLKLADFAEIVNRKSDIVEDSISKYHKEVKKLLKDK